MASLDKTLVNGCSKQAIGRRKIALIGSGAIGGNIALLAGMKKLADVVMFDVVKGMPAGKALDIHQSAHLLGFDMNHEGCNDYSIIEGADVVIVTAGLTKVPGKSDAEWNREDLLPLNGNIMKQVGENIKRYCPEAFVICITNPLDCMVRVLKESMGACSKKVCGMGGVLDSSRFATFIADRLNVSKVDVQAMVIGSHGEHMIPLPRYASVNGIPLQEFINRGEISQAEVDGIVHRSIQAGKEIMTLLGQGSAFYAPAVAALEMAQAYLLDEKRVLVCAVCPENGEYGVTEKGLYVGLPVVIGKDGVERIINLELNPEERNKLNVAIKSISEMNSKMTAIQKRADTGPIASVEPAAQRSALRTN